MLLGAGQQDWNTTYILSSHDIDQNHVDENLQLDGETGRVALTYRYGLSDRLTVGIELPYVYHSPGFLDSPIDSWHDFFGLPEGSRESREQDQLEFLYQDTQLTRVDLTQDANGIGDVSLLAGWLLSDSEGHSTALRLAVKFPTGDSDDLLGSGGTDISLGLAGDIERVLGNEKLSSFYRLNVTYLGEPDLLADLYNDFVGQASAGLAYHFNNGVDLALQSRIRSAVYDSDVKNLGETSVTLTFGAGFRVSEHNRLVLSVGEDIRPGSAPDVTFQITFQYVGSRAGQ